MHAIESQSLDFMGISSFSAFPFGPFGAFDFR